MNLDITIKGDSLVVQALSSAPKQVAAGQRRAKNRAASRLRTQGVRRIGQRVHLKASYIREQISLRNAKGDGPATVTGRTRETRMDRFPNRQLTKRGKGGKSVPAGISVRIKRGRGPITLSSAFYVPLRKGKRDGAGGQGIAMRTAAIEALGRVGAGQGIRSDAEGFGTFGQTAGRGAREYEVLHSSSIRDMLADELDGDLTADIRRYYAQQLQAELRRATARARRA